MEEPTLYCTVCGTPLQKTEWREMGSFSLITGKPEFVRFRKCSYDLQGAIPVNHTIVTEIGYYSYDGSMTVISCKTM